MNPHECRHPPDFESGASANSATPAREQSITQIPDSGQGRGAFPVSGFRGSEASGCGGLRARERWSFRDCQPSMPRWGGGFAENEDQNLKLEESVPWTSESRNDRRSNGEAELRPRTTKPKYEVRTLRNPGTSEPRTLAPVRDSGRWRAGGSTPRPDPETREGPRPHSPGGGSRPFRPSGSG